jgi:hypothetical protein
MTPGILIPVILIAVVVPVAFSWLKKLKSGASGSPADEHLVLPSARLTSNALRELESPSWRVVYEIGQDKLGDVEHVLIGPVGIFAMRTSMEPLPQGSQEAPDPKDVAAAAIARGDLDDALAGCAMSSDRLIAIHWGAIDGDHGPSIDMFAGLTAVDGRAIGTWFNSLPNNALTGAQVDLAWQTVLTAIGRPNPLA